MALKPLRKPVRKRASEQDRPEITPAEWDARQAKALERTNRVRSDPKLKAKMRAGEVPKPPARKFYDSEGNVRRPTWAEMDDWERAYAMQLRAQRTKERSKRVATIPDRYQEFISGELKIEDLDDEEIFRAQLRNKNGDFRGAPPKYVPREFLTAVREEQARRFSSEMNGLVPEAVKSVGNVLRKKHPQPGDGAIVQAAFKTIERFAGKPAENINIKAEVETYERHIEDVIVEVEYEDE